MQAPPAAKRTINPKDPVAASKKAFDELMERSAKEAGQSDVLPGTLPPENVAIKDPIPTMEQIRAEKDMKKRAALLAKRTKMLRRKKREDYRKRIAIPRAQRENAAREWRLRTFGSAWSRARIAERNAMRAKAGASRTAAALNRARNPGRVRYIERNGRVYDTAR